MSRRKYHSKSRLGCEQCKKNRTKCDEQKPICGRCRRIEVTCSLSNSSEIEFVNNSALNDGDTLQNRALQPRCSPAATSNDDSPAISQATKASCSFNDTERERLRLMHHYTISTAQTVAEVVKPGKDDPDIWSTFVPELALQHDFLLHGLLRLSSLHVALLDPSKQPNLLLAIRHYEKGSALFWPCLSDISSDNYEALLAFSLIASLYSFGILKVTEPNTSIIEKLCQILMFIRGTGAVVKYDFEAIRQTRWKTIFIRHPFHFVEVLPAQVDDMFANLESCLSTSLMTDLKKEIYSASIKALHLSIRCAFTYRHSRNILTLFPAMAPAGFSNLVQAREPLALAILANYGVILHWQRENIWLGRWGLETIHAVQKVLPIQLLNCIAWAVTETEHDG